MHLLRNNILEIITVDMATHTSVYIPEARLPDLTLFKQQHDCNIAILPHLSAGNIIRPRFGPGRKLKLVPNINPYIAAGCDLQRATWRAGVGVGQGVGCQLSIIYDIICFCSE